MISFSNCKSSHRRSVIVQQEMENLKTRGVKSVGLVVSGLTFIENASAKVFPEAKHQLCVVHLNEMY